MSHLRSLFYLDGSVVNYRIPKNPIALGPRSDSGYHPVVEARRDITKMGILRVGFWPIVAPGLLHFGEAVTDPKRTLTELQLKPRR